MTEQTMTLTEEDKKEHALNQKRKAEWIENYFRPMLKGLPQSADVMADERYDDIEEAVATMFSFMGAMIFSSPKEETAMPFVDFTMADGTRSAGIVPQMGDEDYAIRVAARKGVAQYAKNLNAVVIATACESWLATAPEGGDTTTPVSEREDKQSAIVLDVWTKDSGLLVTAIIDEGEARYLRPNVMVAIMKAKGEKMLGKFIDLADPEVKLDGGLHVHEVKVDAEEAAE